MLSIVRSCILKQTKKSIAVLSGITIVITAASLSSKASLSSMAAVQGVDFHKLSTETKVKTLPDGPEITAKSLWDETGAVIQIVRRPG